MDASPQDLDAVLTLINELARKSAGSGYVYRGEPALFEDISSSLYRRCRDQGIDDRGSAIEAIQNEIIAQARRHEPQLEEMREFEVLAQIQHNGGKTNLIDFTTDYLVALFFACDGEPNEPGRVILLSERGEGYYVDRPTSPVHRVVAQKSVFVRPEKGFVQPDDTVLISEDLKQSVLEYLHRHHGISTETIYNDLYGFIQHQDIHQPAYFELYTGIILANEGRYDAAVQRYSNAIALNPRMVTAYSHRGDAYYDLSEYDLAIEDYEHALLFDPQNDAVFHNLGLAYAGKGDHREAIRFYDQALELNPDLYTRYYRFESFLLLEEWDRAEEEIRFAAFALVNIAAILREHYSDVSNFEQENNVQLPDNIAELLGGR